MRKVRHLEYVDYVIPVGQKTSQVIPLSCNILLQKTWNKAMREDFELTIHAKFDSDSMNGFDVIAFISKNGRQCSSANASLKVFRVSEGSWQETLILSSSMVSAGTSHTKYFSQADLGSNELSGRETYSIEVTVFRKRQLFRGKIYFNHLGVYDHLMVVRHRKESLEILKVSE